MYIIEDIDEHIEEEFESDRVIGNECVRRVSMLSAVLPYSSHEIAAALRIHGDQSRFEVDHPNVGVWRFKR